MLRKPFFPLDNAKSRCSSVLKRFSLDACWGQGLCAYVKLFLVSLTIFI